MKVALAKRVGFCFGVKRAVRMAEAALAKRRPIYSLGSIIHNRHVVEMLSAKGLTVIDRIGRARGGTVVVSSHGLSPQKAAAIRRKGLAIIDTTCPFVRNAQKIAAATGLSDLVIIVGDANHPEVRALVDFVPRVSAGRPRVRVVRNAAEAAKVVIRPTETVSVLSQTTQSTANFIGAVGAVVRRMPKRLHVFNTICRDAEDRQRAASALAARVDAMVVVGGANSANTRRLADVCTAIAPRTYHIETEADLEPSRLVTCRTVGVTSGASTPDWIIRRVIARIKTLPARGKRRVRAPAGRGRQ